MSAKQFPNGMWCYVKYEKAEVDRLVAADRVEYSKQPALARTA